MLKNTTLLSLSPSLSVSLFLMHTQTHTDTHRHTDTQTHTHHTHTSNPRMDIAFILFFYLAMFPQEIWSYIKDKKMESVLLHPDLESLCLKVETQRTFLYFII